MELIIKSITAVGDEMKKLQEENHLEMAQLISVIELSPAKVTKNASGFPLASAPTFSIPNPFLINNNVVQPSRSYVFILKVTNLNVPVGQIRIRPAPKFHPEFVQKLGEFCHRSPNKFSSTLNKVCVSLFNATNHLLIKISPIPNFFYILGWWYFRHRLEYSSQYR